MACQCSHEPRPAGRDGLTVGDVRTTSDPRIAFVDVVYAAWPKCWPDVEPPKAPQPPLLGVVGRRVRAGRSHGFYTRQALATRRPSTRGGAVSAGFLECLGADDEGDSEGEALTACALPA